jgi:hypothetical protein
MLYCLRRKDRPIEPRMIEVDVTDEIAPSAPPRRVAPESEVR